MSALFEAQETVSSWRRWLNLWRLRHSYSPDGMAVEFYRTRRGIVVTRVVKWSTECCERCAQECAVDA